MLVRCVTNFKAVCIHNDYLTLGKIRLGTTKPVAMNRRSNLGWYLLTNDCYSYCFQSNVFVTYSFIMTIPNQPKSSRMPLQGDKVCRVGDMPNSVESHPHKVTCLACMPETKIVCVSKSDFFRSYWFCSAQS